MSQSTETTERTGERRVISNIVKGSIGNLIEWYDATYAPLREQRRGYRLVTGQIRVLEDG
ncbi:hypothetical protein EV193_104411 [Herbihabitans rhizosphaerae]|uniref:Uncharacterized protein n=1 Tax=Herbihabitans rhizosphaerae TaxID=1872711 RepID=A0A4Q7KRK9_9PSEU|nr:hypothetical protein EV193_104411 [Herbihabitans rhizosphaerae]